jgi:hypothetical protein
MLLAGPPAFAAFHQWRFGEIFSSADGTVQFIELINPTIATGETVSINAEIRTNSGNVYDFSANISGNTANKRLLIATNDFELIPGSVVPNFAAAAGLVADFFDPAGDTLRLFQPNFGEFTSVSWTGATAVPTDNLFSRTFSTACVTCTTNGIAANSPTNFAGAAGSINRGDYNRDGAIDAADYVHWRKTLSESASPSGLGADGDTDGSIDDGDYDLWRARFGVPIAGALGAGSGGGVPEPASIAMFLFAWAVMVSRRRLV